jgi:hypothetical protein
MVRQLPTKILIFKIEEETGLCDSNFIRYIRTVFSWVLNSKTEHVDKGQANTRARSVWHLGQHNVYFTLGS